MKTKRWSIMVITLLLLVGSSWTAPLVEANDHQVIVVKKGDTLYDLSKQFDCELEEIVEQNQLKDPSLIRVGQRLEIPKKAEVHDEQDKENTATNHPQPTLSRGKPLGTFTLTAYTAGPESTGKTKSDPGYGVTASGAVVQDGLTIAVDPEVIPIGSRVYIEGVGYRVAQDIGSAIQGRKIDVFIRDHQAAKEFGVKKNIRVELVEW